MKKKDIKEVAKLWERKELKKRAKLIIKKNIWTLLFVGIFRWFFMFVHSSTIFGKTI